MHLAFFFFNDTATTEIYTLSLHDALPIFAIAVPLIRSRCPASRRPLVPSPKTGFPARAGVEKRSEEHTSELQSQSNLVCRLLLEKKKAPVSSRRNQYPADFTPPAHSASRS